MASTLSVEDNGPGGSTPCKGKLPRKDAGFDSQPVISIGNTMELTPKYRQTTQTVYEQTPLTPSENARRLAERAKKKALGQTKYVSAHEKLHYEFEAIIRKHFPSVYPHMVSEHQFYPPVRFRFDYAFLAWKVGIEIQGGIYINRKKGRGSGHVSVKGMENDMTKLNLAQGQGWVLLQFSPNRIRREPAYIVSTILAAINIQIGRTQR